MHVNNKEQLLTDECLHELRQALPSPQDYDYLLVPRIVLPVILLCGVFLFFSWRAVIG